MMDPLLIVVTFVISWCLSLFFVLPIGVRTMEAPEPLHTPGAPTRSHLPAKFAAAAGIAAVVTASIAFVWQSGWVSFR